MDDTADFPADISPLEAALTALLWIALAAAVIALATWLFSAGAGARPDKPATHPASVAEAAHGLR